MDQEMGSLDRNQTWTLVDLSKTPQGNRLQMGLSQEGQ